MDWIYVNSFHMKTHIYWEIEMRIIGLALTLLGTACALPPATAERPAAPVAAPIKGQMTFLYYKDLPAAAAFYEKLLGTPPQDTPAWVRLFDLTDTATLGLVNAQDGTLRPSDNKPVMVTVVVDGVAAVDAWYDRVRAQGIAISEERKTTRLDDKRSIHAFIFKDPEGYAIEILSWTASQPR